MISSLMISSLFQTLLTTCLLFGQRSTVISSHRLAQTPSNFLSFQLPRRRQGTFAQLSRASLRKAFRLSSNLLPWSKQPVELARRTMIRIGVYGTIFLGCWTNDK